MAYLRYSAELPSLAKYRPRQVRALDAKRPSLRRLQAALTRSVSAFLQSQAAPMAAQIGALMDERGLRKAAPTDDDLDFMDIRTALRDSVNYYQGTYYMTRERAEQVAAQVGGTFEFKRRGYVVITPKGRLLGPPSAARVKDAVLQTDALVARLNFAGWSTLVTDVEGTLAAIVKDGSTAAFHQVGIDVESRREIVNVVNSHAVEYGRQRAAAMVGMRVDALGGLIQNPNAIWRITEGTREYLRANIRDAIDKGWSNDTLAAEIAQSYGFSKQRAMVIARTETNRASNAGALESYKESGVVGAKEWLTAQDDKVTPDCELNGEAGPVALNLPFPSGAMSPPDHPNCRCTIIPVVDWTAVSNLPRDLQTTTTAPKVPKPRKPRVPRAPKVVAPPVVVRAPTATLVPITSSVQMGVEWVGSIPEAFRALITSTIARIPEGAARALIKGRQRIRVGERMTILEPSLKGVHPRGWTRGATWDSVEGMYSPRNGTINVAATKRPIGSRTFTSTSAARAISAVTHEAGHGLDQALNRMAVTSTEFAVAYARDVGMLSAMDRRVFSYYLQTGEAGRQEAFAEVFSQTILGGGNGAVPGSDIIKAFPNVAAFMRALLAKLEATP